MKNTIFFCAVALLFVVPSDAGGGPPYPVQASMIQLIATPERFDGKLVSTSGFLSIEREAALLFLDKESCDHLLSDNAIWFFLNEELGKNREKLNRNYVILVGVFRNQKKGSGTNPNGGLDPVQRFAVVSLGSSANKASAAPVMR